MFKSKFRSKVGTPHSTSFFFVALGLLVFSLLFPAGALAVQGIDTGLTGDDNAVNNLPIGFTFTYWGTDYTTFGVSTNGWISLTNTASGTYSNVDFPMTASPTDGMIALFFDDLRMDVSGQPNGRIYYYTTGTAPNRSLVIQYHDVFFYGSNLPMGTFEAVLFETTNQIQFQYRFLTSPESFGTSATIGFDEPGGANFVRYSYNSSSLSEQQAILISPDGAGGYTTNPSAPYSWVDISGMTANPPSDGGDYAASTISFAWDPVSGANAYRIDIASSPNEADIIESVPLGDVAAYDYSNSLVEGNSYFARVAASANGGGTYQNPSDFSDGIIVDQTPPSVSVPVAGPGAGTGTVEFQFGGTDNFTVASYHIQIAEDGGFATPLVDTEITTVTYTHAGTEGQTLYAQGICH